jgi:poly(ADP-ribose) glycohydrolase ARH3
MRWLHRLFGTPSGPASAARLGKALGSSPHEDRCIGSLLGCAAGDILGANLEFRSREEIQRGHGRVENFLDSAARPLGVFTDDTEMTLALAVSLIECGTLDPKHCATTYARFFGAEPRRGYGPAVSKVLAMLQAGSDYRKTGRAVYPEGSFANGGAMRIAPVGLAFRNAADTVLRQAVEMALLCTHVHPDAVDGAFVQAKAVSELARCGDPAGFDVARFLSSLQSMAESALLREKLGILLRAGLQDWQDEEVLSAVRSPNEYGEQFQIHAAEAVACALWAFACSPYEPEECLIRAVCLGGDTDTVGAMAGALAGALHGSSWMPCRWFDQMENAPGVGRDYLIDVARQLAKLDLSSVIAELAAAPDRGGIAAF